MKFPWTQAITCALALCNGSFARPLTSDSGAVSKRADPSKVGYLGVYWTTADESVYFALTDNANPTAFQAINGGNAIVSPTLGTKAVRDVSIIPADGKWYIIGTDLNIDETTWDASTRTGSRGILVWESTDLITWTNERLVVVEGDTAGMVWAPDAIFDAAQNQFLVHWASKFYAEDDPEHTGDATTNVVLRYAYTSDFETFSEPATYIDKGDTGVLDLSFLQVDDNTFVRYYGDNAAGGIVAEVSTSGLFGTWERPTDVIATNYEGPYPYWDNEVDGTAYLLSDLVGGSAGLRAFVTTDVTSGTFTQDTSVDISFMRHGSVLPVTQDQYDALSAL
ncbi:uncharacterized protein Z518_03421 [Rhinocladiella mackenziei CBS 650.93]|uniref:Rhinocladiella mackenziei CBS 650.93 unplaced genomic scaffold supercont1.2, whole genome shotgun sequence n=1 Tax=Rhinocladiella mackenziei CBS 650.93 TaxID=1442369 RepID=A0A0D2IRY9_9EURO|nr:uncharacterized protein Z518_03421 [Rhinocladiella mackenziei CBS 650.93]KIX08764.1 hypothetical protein Z518_03421 [Rhinocladiella mackenziei CBS 650.93]